MGSLPGACVGADDEHLVAVVLDNAGRGVDRRAGTPPLHTHTPPPFRLSSSLNPMIVSGRPAVGIVPIIRTPCLSRLVARACAHNALFTQCSFSTALPPSLPSPHCFVRRCHCCGGACMPAHRRAIRSAWSNCSTLPRASSCQDWRSFMQSLPPAPLPLTTSQPLPGVSEEGEIKQSTARGSSPWEKSSH